jgi:hypothetical protein
LARKNAAAILPPIPITTKRNSLPVVREYEIGGVKYTVTAAVRDGANEDAATKVRRLIRRELNGGDGRAAEKLYSVDF